MLSRRTSLKLPPDFIDRLRSVARRRSYETGNDITWTSLARELLVAALKAAEDQHRGTTR